MQVLKNVPKADKQPLTPKAVPPVPRCKHTCKRAHTHCRESRYLCLQNKRAKRKCIACLLRRVGTPFAAVPNSKHPLPSVPAPARSTINPAAPKRPAFESDKTKTPTTKKRTIENDTDERPNKRRCKEVSGNRHSFIPKLTAH